MRNVDRVWYERGDWKDITEEGLHSKLAKNGNSKGSTNATNTISTDSMDEKSVNEKQPRQSDETVTNMKNDHETTMVDEGKLRESVISKL